MPLDSLLPLTPLQSLLGFDYLPYRYHGAIELAFAFLCFAAAIALRRRRRIVTSPSFIMLGLGALIDLVAGSAVSNPRVASGFGGAAGLLFFWGVVRLLMDAVDYTSRRASRDVSNILRDLISLSLYAAVLVGVLAADFKVNVCSLVASVGVLGVVIGFAVQQTLGDIFSVPSTMVTGFAAGSSLAACKVSVCVRRPLSHAPTSASRFPTPPSPRRC